MPIVWGRGMTTSLDSLAKRFGSETEGVNAEKSGAASAEEAAPKGPFQEWLDSRGGPFTWEAPHFGVMVGEIERLAANVQLPISNYQWAGNGEPEDEEADGEGRNCKLQSGDCKLQIGPEAEGGAEDDADGLAEAEPANCRVLIADCKSLIEPEVEGSDENRASPPASRVGRDRPLLREEGGAEDVELGALAVALGEGGEADGRERERERERERGGAGAGSGRLMLFLPPRHGKSELATVRYCAYRLEKDPTTRIILGAHTQELAAQFSRKIRRIVRQKMKLSAERYAQCEWETQAGGGLRAAGVGTGIAGMGADLIIIDDPVKSRQEADSRTYRDRVWEWYTDDLYTRQQPDCAIVLIQTRWHEDDLAGRILHSEDGAEWRIVRLPAYAETQEERDAWAERMKCPTGRPDPIGRGAGAVLWPDQWPAHKLEPFRRTLGRSFQALYQQSPLPASGGLFQRSWFNTVDEPPPSCRWIRFWDCAAKTSQRNDFTVGALCTKTPAGRWVIKHVVRGRWDYPEAKRVILQTAKTDGAATVIAIEDSANGTAILQDLKRDEAAAKLTIHSIRVSTDKGVRAGPWAAMAEAGMVDVVAGPWLQDFLDEVCVFPLGGHDDQVDAVSGAYSLVCEKPGVCAVERWVATMPPDYVEGTAPRHCLPW